MGTRGRLTSATCAAGARAVAAGIAIVAVSLVASCRGHKDGDPNGEAGAPGAHASARPPVDRLSPDELLEAPVRALEMPLPLEILVETNTREVFIGYSDKPPAYVEEFMKKRAPGAKITSEPGKLTLENVRLPANPSRVLEIRVRRVTGAPGAHIEVRDATPLPKKDLPNDDARLREVGIDRTGTLIDPLNMQ